MNVLKLKSADFLVGKILSLGKALFDVLLLLICEPSKRSFRLGRLIFQVKPNYTMISTTRLTNLYDLVQKANAAYLPGDIVECGVWNGGSAAVMGAAGQNDPSGMKRKLWLFDSFEGLPPPGERDGKLERNSYFEGWCKGNPKKVVGIFNKLGLSLEDVKIVPGFFDSTLGTVDISAIALLHIDADWHDSVKMVLEQFYDRVVPGGFIVLNDYWTWQGCREAVSDYIKEHSIEGIAFRKIDSQAVCFRKPGKQSEHE